jgi:homoserine kinase type II
MGVYSKMTLEEINEILNFYDFGMAKSFQPTVEGISNSNYHVILVSGDEILLKISNDKNIEQLENEQRILHVLSKHHYKYSPGAFETLEGGLVYRHKDYYGVIFPFIRGNAPQITPDTCKQIGHALAELHTLDIDKEDLESIRPYDHVGYGGMNIYDYTLEKTAAEDFVKTFNKVFPDKLQTIPYDMFPAGIIHGDLYFDNCLFDDGQLATLLDFEQSGRGRFILDIGIAISGGCLTNDHKNIDDNLVEHFLKGYETARSLTTLEKEYMPNAILVGFFSIALWRIKRFYDGKLDARKKHNYRELLEKADAYYTRLNP